MEILFGPDEGLPKFQLHVLAPVDWSVKFVGGVFTQTGGAIKFATGNPNTVTFCEKTEAHPLGMAVTVNVAV